MKVLLDGKPIAVSRSDVATALADGVRLAEQDGRVIIEVLGDGTKLDEATLASRTHTTPLQVLELRSAEPRQLIVATLQDSADALNHARTEQLIAAHAIQRGEPEKSLDSIRSALETWQLVRDAAARAGVMWGVNFLAGEAREIGTNSVDEKELARSLSVLRDAFTNEDWAALSDVLAYQLTPQADQWRQALSSWAAAIASGSLPRMLSKSEVP